MFMFTIGMNCHKSSLKLPSTIATTHQSNTRRIHTGLEGLAGDHELHQAVLDLTYRF